MDRKLHKSDTNKKISGVCAGIAETLNIDISIVRIGAFFLCILYPATLIAYFLLAIFLPFQGSNSLDADDNDLKEESNENAVPLENNYTFAFGAFLTTAVCLSLGYVINNYFENTLGMEEALVYSLLSLGLYIFFAGIFEKSDSRNSKITKLSIGAVITVMSLSKAIQKLNLTLLPFNDLALSAIYFWPILILVLGITIIISNKKVATAVWVAIIILIGIFTIASRLLIVAGY